jgi:hypothetical protein
LMSRMSNPRSSQTRAASAITAGSAPKSCAEIHRSAQSRGFAGECSRRLSRYGCGRLSVEQRFRERYKPEARRFRRLSQ